MSLRATIRHWYDGEYVSDRDAGVTIIYCKRHWSSRFAHTLVEFYLKEWKWIWGTLIVVGLAIVKLH